MKYLLSALLIMCSLVSCTQKSDSQIVPAEERRGSIIEVPEQEAEGFSWPYILYLPDTIANHTTPCLFIANNTPSPHDDFTHHYEQAKKKVEQYRGLSDDLGIPLIVFAIPRFETAIPEVDLNYDDVWLIDPQALTRNTLVSDISSLNRLDLQVVHIIDHAAALLRGEGITTTGKIIPFGFSSSGTFASRFTLLHPERVEMVIAGAPGGWFTLPLQEYEGTELRYPVGISDLYRLTAIQFDLDKYKKIPKFYFVGTEDENNAVPYLDAYAFEDRITIQGLFGIDPQIRFRHYTSIMKKLDIQLQFTFYDGMGHYLSDEAYDDIIEFVTSHLDDTL